MTEPTQRSAAYFDLDKTILATSTTLAMGAPMRRSGMISTWSLARGIIAQLPYLVAGADEAQSARLMNQLAQLSAGNSRHQLEGVVEEALHTAIEPAIYAEALDLVEMHHQAGQDVVVVSASLREMVEPVARLIGADRCAATEMEVDDAGLYTGKIAHSLLHNAKVEAIVQDAAEHHLNLEKSWAYSDSISDLPMLELVGQPMAVNPDRELREIAQERGWPVRDFTRPVALRQAWAAPEVRLPELPEFKTWEGSLPRLSAGQSVLLGVAGLALAAGTAYWLVRRRGR